jgi:glycosyltransferase involved in cell wall biosynthesis
MFTSQDITVYVPYYCASSTIEACINSLKSQSVKFAQLIVIDDGSPEPLPSSIAVEVIKHNVNKGLAAGRNTALSLCSTPLLAAIDADVVVEEDWLENLLKSLNKHDAAGVGGQMVEHNQNNIGDRWRAVHMAQHWGGQSLVNPRFLFGANTLFKVSALRSVGGFDESCRTNNEDRTVSEALYKADFQLVYEPAAQCRHLRQDEAHTTLRAYWGWHHAKGVKDGDFKTPEGLVSRIERVNFGISEYRFKNDMSNERKDFAVLDLLVPLVFCCSDLEYYQRTTRGAIPDFNKLIDLFSPEYKNELTCFLPKCSDTGVSEDWHREYLKVFEENLIKFMTKEYLSGLDFSSWLYENINSVMLDRKP